MSIDAQATVNAGHLIARRLRASGIDTIFTLSGGHLFSIYDGCRAEGVRLIDTRHEQTAAFAAEGWSKVTRVPGVAALTAGPGVTNGMSAMAAAQQNQSPLVVLGGRAPALRWGQGSLQEIDHVPFVAPLTRFAATAQSADAVGGLIDDALRAAVGAPSGVAFVDFPMDHVFGEAHDAGGPGALIEPPAPLPPDGDALDAAARPAGRRAAPGHHGRHQRVVGTRRGGAAAAGRAAAHPGADERHGPRHRACRPRAGVFPGPVKSVGGGRCCAGHRGADGLPARLRRRVRRETPSSSPPTASRPTSPIPRAVAAGLYGDLTTILSALSGAKSADHEAWIGELRAVETAARAAEQAELTDDRTPLHPMRVYAELAPLLDRDAIVVIDAGDFGSYAGRVIDSYVPGAWLDSGPFGCLGSGPGYALAAKLARPDRQVVLLQGDGAFGFSGMEWDTLVRHGVHVVSVIGNNGIWALEKHPMEMLYGYSVVAELRPGTRYDEVVTALGGHGELVSTPAEIRPALERAFSSGLPAVVNALTDPAVAYPRRSNLA